MKQETTIEDIKEELETINRIKLSDLAPHRIKPFMRIRRKLKAELEVKKQ